jgi:hypothetical protein
MIDASDHSNGGGAAMRYGSLAFAAAAALLVTAPLAMAFQIQNPPTNSDGTVNLTDPGSATDTMAAHLTGGSTASTGSTLHFGSTTLSFGVDNGSGAGMHAMSPALQERLMGGYDGVGASALPNR